MGFLDNSGDIILDAVLTDLGRKRLAEGNFKIIKFAVADDEINYTLYNPSHPSGSSYYDLEIIQTPILESFTNNTSTMKSRLISITDTGLLYLPVIKEYISDQRSARHSSGAFLVAVDDKTQRTTPFLPGTAGAGVGKSLSSQPTIGVLSGLDPQNGLPGMIVLHQGIDNTARGKGTDLSAILTEDQYIIQIDGRFGSIVNENGDPVTTGETSVVTQDDDGFVFYTVSRNGTSGIVGALGGNDDSPIAGSRGTKLTFKIKASDILTDNQSYFDRFGFAAVVETKSCKVIDTMVRVSGVKTGYSIDVPVRFVKDIT